MNTRSVFLIGTLAGLALVTPALVTPAFAAPPPATVGQADTPAVAVVRQFLADRSAGRFAAAYALLSSEFRQSEPEDAFAAASPPSAGDMAQLSTPLIGVIALLSDTQNTLHRNFTVLGPDPAVPGGVLIRMMPPGITLSLLAVPDPVTHRPQLDPEKSLEHASPKEFFQAREKARQATSLSNLRQLALGALQYNQDNDERMPDAAHWVDAILPYVKTEAIFRDPSAPAGEKWSYAFNHTLSQQLLAAFDYPSHTVLLFESNLGVKNASDTGQSVPVPGRHLGGTDYATADGHAQWFPYGTKLSYRLDGK